MTQDRLWLALAQFGAFINLLNLIPIWQLDGGRVFRTLNRPQRWLAVTALATAWALTEDGMLLILMLVGVARTLFDKPSDRPDRGRWRSTSPWLRPSRSWPIRRTCDFGESWRAGARPLDIPGDTSTLNAFAPRWVRFVHGAARTAEAHPHHEGRADRWHVASTAVCRVAPMFLICALRPAG